MFSHTKIECDTGTAPPPPPKGPGELRLTPECSLIPRGMVRGHVDATPIPKACTRKFITPNNKQLGHPKSNS